MPLITSAAAMVLVGSMSLFSGTDVQADVAPPAARPNSLVGTKFYLAYHPDLQYQLDAQAAYDDGKFGKALWLFKFSAAYGDKGSQAMIAEMYWRGLGVAPDRATAYAWMDLASSRGSRKLTLLREYYWSQLNAAERQQAVQVGQAIFAEYGDHLTLPRMQDKLRSRERHNRMARAMSAGVNMVHFMPVGGGRTLAGIKGPPDEPHWDPDRYLEWRDAFFENPSGAQVEVGRLQVSAGKDEHQ